MTNLIEIERINKAARAKFGSLRAACKAKGIDYADIQADFTSFRYKQTPEKVVKLSKYLEIIER